MSVTIHPPGQAEAASAAPAMPAPVPAPASPSAEMIRAANAVRYCVDARGRKIGWRRLSALEDFDLVEIAGSSASNEEWMLRATIAYGVREIDGEACPRPTTKRELRAMVGRLEGEGMTAILGMFSTEAPSDGAAPRDAEMERARNFPGTPA